MKVTSIFNNKGGVGKSTLSFHLGKALGLLGKGVLFVDLDPQCNLTISAMREEEIEKNGTKKKHLSITLRMKKIRIILDFKSCLEKHDLYIFC